MSQNLLLLVVAGMLLKVSLLSETYVNYVKPGFRPMIIAAGVVMAALALAGLLGAWRNAPRADNDQGDHGPDHGHDHGHGPRVAWLMAVPVFALTLVAPPALGAFAVQREERPPPPKVSDYRNLGGAGVTPLAVGEFIGRAYGRSLVGKRVKLTGFVVKSSRTGQWYVARMQMSCCAADAIALKVAVRGASAPKEDTWVEVTGTWIPWKGGKVPNGFVAPGLTASDVKEIDQPAEPYE
ncbi:TIGR03943 family protein [Nonomuraea sp. NPDC005983]|uniref:TIGR03943 family putative permease subunit n=1 Tax=Nonomuraea sp. NPDC005983 TaxID=3155595 RepID=UPI0033AECB77